MLSEFNLLLQEKKKVHFKISRFSSSGNGAEKKPLKWVGVITFQWGCNFSDSWANSWPFLDFLEIYPLLSTHRALVVMQWQREYAKKESPLVKKCSKSHLCCKQFWMSTATNWKGLIWRKNATFIWNLSNYPTSCTNSCLIISLFYASTCFEHYVLIIRRSKLYYTASGIITLCRWPSGAQVERVMLLFCAPNGHLQLWWYQMQYKKILTLLWWAQ